ncbi:MAG: hypothetical protein KAV18_03400 [Candidatus Omnitrophica bacterium]|nr:hypothetical protein [Candidatus Omnitrophota bacterium]
MLSKEILKDIYKEVWEELQEHKDWEPYFQKRKSEVYIDLLDEMPADEKQLLERAGIEDEKSLPAHSFKKIFHARVDAEINSKMGFLQGWTDRVGDLDPHDEADILYLEEKLILIEKKLREKGQAPKADIQSEEIEFLPINF